MGQSGHDQQKSCRVGIIIAGFGRLHFVQRRDEPTQATNFRKMF
jgi:hypothetical protein